MVMTMLNQEAPPAVVELAENNIFQLPAGLVGDFHPGERFLVLRMGDTILFKRMQPRRITDIVANAPATEPPLTMEEISEIVHDVRRQQSEEA